MSRRPVVHRPVRLLLANLHTTSRPAVVVPWLVANCLARRVDAVLLQECTDRHARVLRRLPRWELVRKGDEAILGRRRHLTDGRVIDSLESAWRGKHTDTDHAPRTIPFAVVRGWLTVVAVHFPPGWENGPEDRRKAGQEYIDTLEDLAALLEPAPLLLGGDWNALRLSKALRSFWRYYGLTAYGRGIDYVTASNGVYLADWHRIGRAPGMDHNAVLCVARHHPLTEKATS